MSREFSDRLKMGGIEYRIGARPLERAFELFNIPALMPIWPVSSRGYIGYWAIVDDCLVLESMWPDETDLGSLFPGTPQPIFAHWYSGIFRGRGGERRFTGAFAQQFYNDEFAVEIENGVVSRL